jgi:hypothetical protein
MRRRYQSQDIDKRRESSNKHSSLSHVKNYHKENSRRQRKEGYYLEYQRKNREQFRKYSEDHRFHKKHDITKREWELCKQYFNNACAYCEMTLGKHIELFNEDLHKEHVLNEGLNDLSNCIPSCRLCNSSKNVKDTAEWYGQDNPVYSEERLCKINRWLSTDYLQFQRNQ